MKHASLRLAVVGALVALALAGCGGASKTGDAKATNPKTNATQTNAAQTNGLEKKSAAQVQLAAAAALKTAKQGHWEGLSLDAIASELAINNDSPLEPTVQQTTLDGRKVVVISQQNGSKLSIANTGPAYPLHGDYKGVHPGRMDFTEYGADFHFTRPATPSTSTRPANLRLPGDALGQGGTSALTHCHLDRRPTIRQPAHGFIPPPTRQSRSLSCH